MNKCSGFSPSPTPLSCSSMSRSLERGAAVVPGLDSVQALEVPLLPANVAFWGRPCQVFIRW